MSPMSSRAQGFTVGNIGNLRSDLLADYNQGRLQNASQLEQQAGTQEEEKNNNVNLLNAIGLGALGTALVGGAYALTRGRKAPGVPGAHVDAMNSGAYQQTRRVNARSNQGFYTQTGQEKIAQLMKDRAAAGASIYDLNTGINRNLDPEDVANYGLTVRRPARDVQSKNDPRVITQKLRDSQQRIEGYKQALNADPSIAPENKKPLTMSPLEGTDIDLDVVDSIGLAKTDSQKDPMFVVNAIWPRNIVPKVFRNNSSPQGVESPSRILQPQALIELAAQGLIPLDIAKEYMQTGSSANRTSVLRRGADAQKNQLMSLGLLKNKYGNSEISDTQQRILERATGSYFPYLLGDTSADTARLIAGGGSIPFSKTKGATAYNQGIPDTTRVFSSDKGISDFRASAKYDSTSNTTRMNVPSDIDAYKGLRSLVTDLDLSSLDHDNIVYGGAGVLTGPKQNLINQAYRKNIMGMAEALGYSDDQLESAILNPREVEERYIRMEALRQEQGLEPLGLTRNTYQSITGDQLGSVANKTSEGVAGESGQGFTDKQMSSVYAFSPRTLGQGDDSITSLVLTGTGSGSELFNFPEPPTSIVTKNPSKRLNVQRSRYGDEDFVVLNPDEISQLDYDQYVNLPYQINDTGPALVTSGSSDSIGGIRSFGRYSTPVAADIRRNLPIDIRDESVAPYIDGKFSLDLDQIPADTDLTKAQVAIDKANSLLRSYTSDPYKTKKDGLNLLYPEDRKSLTDAQKLQFAQEAVDDGIVRTSKPRQNKDGSKTVSLNLKVPMGLAFSDPQFEDWVNEAALNDRAKINILFNDPYNEGKEFDTVPEAYKTYLTYVNNALQKLGNLPDRSLYGKNKNGSTVIDRAILEGLSSSQDQQIYNQYLQNVKRDLATSFEMSPAAIEVIDPLTRRKISLDPFVTVDYRYNRPTLKNRGSTGTVTPITLQDAVRTKLLNQENSPVRFLNLPGSDDDEAGFYHVKRYAVPNDPSSEYKPSTVLPARVDAGDYQEVIMGDGGYVTDEGFTAVPNNIGFLKAFDDAYQNVNKGQRVGSVAFVLDRLGKLSNSNPEAALFIGGKSSNPALHRALQDAYTIAGISDKNLRLNIQRPPAPATRETGMEGAGFDSYRGFDAATAGSERSIERRIGSIDRVLQNIDPSDQKFRQLQNLKRTALQDLADFRGGRKVVSLQGNPVGLVPTRKGPIADIAMSDETESLLFPRSTQAGQSARTAESNQSSGNVYAEDMGRTPSAAEAQAIYEEAQGSNNSLDNFEERQNLTNNSRAIKSGVGDNVLGGYLSVERAFNPDLVDDLRNLDRRIAGALREDNPRLAQARQRGRLGRFIDSADEVLVMPGGQTELTPEIQQALTSGNRLLMLPSGGMYATQDGRLIRIGRTESELVDRLGLTRENIKTEIARKGLRTVPISELNKPRVSTEEAMTVSIPDAIQGELDLMVPVKKDGQTFLTRYAGGQTGYVPNETDDVARVMKQKALSMPARPMVTAVQYDQPSLYVAQNPLGKLKSVRIDPANLESNDPRRNIYYPSSPIGYTREFLPKNYLINEEVLPSIDQGKLDFMLPIKNNGKTFMALYTGGKTGYTPNEIFDASASKVNLDSRISANASNTTKPQVTNANYIQPSFFLG